MSVTTQHAAYRAAYETWQALRAAYGGSGAVKPEGVRYLPRPLGMRRQAQYDAYKARAIFYGATQRAAEGLTGAIMRREPTVAAPHSLRPQLEDVTQTGIPLQTFATQAVKEALLMGRLGVLVDFPQAVVIPGTTGVTPIAGSRPYWIAYQAEEILNWRTMQRQGDTVLSLVVLQECVSVVQGGWPAPDFFVAKEQRQYRVLRLNEEGLYEVSVWTQDATQARAGSETATLTDIWIPTRNGQPLDFIPFCFLGPTSLGPDIESSILEPLVEVNFQYYRHSADYEHGLHLTALPTPYVTGLTDTSTELLIGSAIAWNLPQGATAGLLEFHGAGLTPHEHAMESDIKNMATLGARLLEGSPLAPETATAVLSRQSGASSPVQGLARTVSQGLTQALQLHAWWAGMTENVDDPAITMTLNDDLISSQLESPMLKELVAAWLSGAITYETLYWNLQQGELTRPMIPVEEEQTLLDIRAAMQPPLATVPAQGAGGTS